MYLCMVLNTYTHTSMGYMDKFTKSEDYRRDEALYYDMTTKNFIND